ncbi:10853_t:CDS:2 [Scutellospora calospora]|uniref:10853_t:CDS:1 n=1 Tax=Scutellospora calospora TaxID=85575 RepID=A0ACA9KN76_9GLOM|nr:10853_t:CDS:2 [Scutellospora calospora]
MSKHFIEFKNRTGLGQYMTFCVYQQMDESEYKDSVAWLMSSIPGGSTSSVSWKLDKYLVALAEYQQKGQIGTYYTKQTAQAELGSAWQIIDYHETQTLVPLNEVKVEPDTIKITNNSTTSADCGIGMWGSTTAFERNLQRNFTAAFKIEPQYWVGVFNTEIHKGQVVEDSNALALKYISFPPEKNLAIVTAVAENEKIILTINYEERSSNAFFRFIQELCAKLFEIMFIVPISFVKRCLKSVVNFIQKSKKKQ